MHVLKWDNGAGCYCPTLPPTTVISSGVSEANAVEGSLFRDLLSLCRFLFSEYNYGKAPTQALSEKLGAFRAALTSEEIKSTFSEYVRAYLEEIPTIGLHYRTHAAILDANISAPSRLAYKNIYADIGQWK